MSEDRAGRAICSSEIWHTEGIGESLVKRGICFSDSAGDGDDGGEKSAGGAETKASPHFERLLV